MWKLGCFLQFHLFEKGQVEDSNDEDAGHPSDEGENRGEEKAPPNDNKDVIMNLSTKKHHHFRSFRHSSSIEVSILSSWDLASKNRTQGIYLPILLTALLPI